MSARNSGASFVLELSRSIVDQLFHEFVLANPKGAVLACCLWPAPAATIDLVALGDGQASLEGISANGTHCPLGVALGSFLEVALGASSLESFVTGALASRLPPNGAISRLPLRVAGGGTALAVGVFLNFVGGQDREMFNQYSEDFLRGRQIGAAASLELIDRLIIQQRSTQDMLRQRLDPYTPDDPNRFATLSAGPPGALRLSGSGVKHTPDCDVHIDWHVDLTPSIVDGFLTIKALVAVSTSTWDVVTCTAGHLLLGALPGILTGDLLAAIIGAFLNRPNFGSGSTSMSQCGDNCYILTYKNPASRDGRLTFTIDDRHSITITDISVDQTGVTLLGNATITPRQSILQVLQTDTWIYPTADSVCAGGPVVFHSASFQLHNPASGNPDFDPPQICTITLTPPALDALAQVVFVPPQNPPLALEDVQPLRVEIPVKPGAQVRQMSGSAVIHTNTAPFTRTVDIFVASVDPGSIQVDPLELDFQQRNVEIVDPRGFRTRAACAEEIPATRQMPQGGSFTIRNTGVGTLQICDLQLQDPTGFFLLPPQRRFSILSGGQKQVLVLLKAGTPTNQQFAASVTILSSDPQTPRLVVNLRGVAIDPPQGAVVGGHSAVIDTLFDSVCIATKLPPEGPPIVDLTDWRKVFVEPGPDIAGSIDIIEATLHQGGPAGTLAVNGPQGKRFTTHPGPDGTIPDLTLTDGQLGKAELGGLDKNAAPRLQLLGFRLSPISSYVAAAPIQDLWSSSPTAALATTKGLEFVDLSEPQKPRQSGIDPQTQAIRFAGRENDLYALTKTGIELFTLGPKIAHRATIALPGVLDLDWGAGSFVFALSANVLLTLGLNQDGTLVPLKEMKVDLAAGQLMIVNSLLYLFGKAHLRIIEATEPWSPHQVGELDLPGVTSIARQGRRLAARGAVGTRMYQYDGQGKLVLIAEYPDGHWSDGLIADRLQRHLFRIDPERKEFGVWQLNQKQAHRPN